MNKFTISDGTRDLLSVRTTADKVGRCQVYVSPRDGSGLHISRHQSRAHLRRPEEPPQGVHPRVRLSNVTDEALARLHRGPELGFEFGLPVSESSAVSYVFESVQPPSGNERYVVAGDTTEIRVVGRSHISHYGRETCVPIGHNPPVWLVLHPLD